MEKNNDQNTVTTNNEEIMDRVNQTFDKISQDVKEMINSNDADSDNNQYS
ncbi:hypothetical protein FB550_12117 [Neobacillus bataviensis]|uniref:Uncharacterized protein n=1 Tax=Neobacillus bataviensis TaxID=220685 RepID=A0A561CK83_9BACI|nr:hypothetical protein [Neobacillus bataviensis]TWD91576.1 hypothetical protein FB550_12117 [Neobacillus bataviensis]